MALNLTTSQADSLLQVVRILQSDDAEGDVRDRLGFRLLELFEADYFASFVFKEKMARESKPVFINMSGDNIAAYNEHFQFHDPITPHMRSCGRAIHVNEIMSQRALERTEFFNDFLAVDGLAFGMNFHAIDGPVGGKRHLGDLRIWRGRSRDNFEPADVKLLQVIGELLTGYLARQSDAMDDERTLSARLIEHYGLTVRECDVLECICEGMRDADIAARLGIGAETVRSHIKSIFQKTGASGRGAVAALVLRATH